jgi:hypothetical protein
MSKLPRYYGTLYEMPMDVNKWSTKNVGFLVCFQRKLINCCIKQRWESGLLKLIHNLIDSKIETKLLCTENAHQERFANIAQPKLESKTLYI